MTEGFNFPSLLNNGGFSILAKGLLGSGSVGVPSTRAHLPILLSRPMMLCSTKLWSSTTALGNTMLSFILTPGPIVTPDPMLTFGPSFKVSVIWLWYLSWSVKAIYENKKVLALYGKNVPTGGVYHRNWKFYFCWESGCFFSFLSHTVATFKIFIFYFCRLCRKIKF